MFGFNFGKKQEEKKDTTGIDLVNAGKFIEAITYYTARIQKNPDDPEALIQMGFINFKREQPVKAKEWYLKAADKNLTEQEILQILEITNYVKISSDKFNNSQPTFSPDGKWIAFTSARKAAGADGKLGISSRPGIYAVNIDTHNEIMISSDNFYNSQPSFSPDGQRVVFLSARKDLNQDGRIDHTELPGIYIKDLDSGKEECIVPPEHRSKFPTFSPDGNSILFCGWHYSRNAGIYLLDLKTRNIKTLEGIFESNFPVFSPKGDKIMFASWRDDTNGDGHIDLRDNSALYHIDLRNGLETLVVSDRYSNSYATFSPDGENILYLSRRRDTNNDGAINSLDNSGIYTMNLARRKEKMIVSDENFNKFPAFSCDGKRAAFISSLRSKSPKKADMDADRSEYFDNKGIYCVDSDGENFREIVPPTYYGCRFLATSPKTNHVAYISWRKDTNRGLYLAPLDRLPTKIELKQIIVNSL